jgi:hypothetical protein
MHVIYLQSSDGDAMSRGGGRRAEQVPSHQHQDQRQRQLARSVSGLNRRRPGLLTLHPRRGDSSSGGRSGGAGRGRWFKGTCCFYFKTSSYSFINSFILHLHQNKENQCTSIHQSYLLIPAVNFNKSKIHSRSLNLSHGVT